MSSSRATGERCARCGGYLLTTDVRRVVDGRPYHDWCSILADDPFATFSEWDGDADRRGYDAL
jgi:hypothetical protein